MARTEARGPHDPRNPPPVPWCPLPKDTGRSRVHSCGLTMSELCRWLLNHTRARTRPCLSCFDLLESVQSEKQTTAALKGLHALTFTRAQAQLTPTCVLELVPPSLDWMMTPQTFHSCCSGAILVQPALFVPAQTMCLPHLHTSINASLCSGNSHNTGGAGKYQLDWLDHSRVLGRKRRDIFVGSMVLIYLFRYCFAVFSPPAWFSAQRRVHSDAVPGCR